MPLMGIELALSKAYAELIASKVEVEHAENSSTTPMPDETVQQITSSPQTRSAHLKNGNALSNEEPMNFDINIQQFPYPPHNVFNTTADKEADTIWIIPTALVLGFTVVILTFSGAPVSHKESGFKVKIAYLIIFHTSNLTSENSYSCSPVLVVIILVGTSHDGNVYVALLGRVDLQPVFDSTGHNRSSNVSSLHSNLRSGDGFTRITYSVAFGTSCLQYGISIFHGLCVCVLQKMYEFLTSHLPVNNYHTNNLPKCSIHCSNHVYLRGCDNLAAFILLRNDPLADLHFFLVQTHFVLDPKFSFIVGSNSAN